MSEDIKTPNSKNPPPECEETELSLEDLDSLLAEEDPSFATEFSGIKAEKIEADLDVEDFEGVDPSQLSKRGRIKNFLSERKTNLLAGLKGIVPFIIGRISGFFRNFFGLIGSFFSMSAKKKAVGLLVLGLTIALLAVLTKGLRGPILPSFELKFLTSFSEVADKSYEIKQGESFEDFDNPLRHPDFVVLIERLVVNLKESEASESPMGMFEFYVEASSQETAVEINDRQKEIRDLMARTLESATHDELVTGEGKDKMKLALRREINTLLTQGRVRRVFFKTIILKP